MQAKINNINLKNKLKKRENSGLLKTNPEMAQMLDIAQPSYYNNFKVLKENMFKDLKINAFMSKCIRISAAGKNPLKNNQMQIL